jgi:hypothetical protein
MVAAVDASQDTQLALLEQLVAINSGTMNLAGVRAVGQRLEPEFRALGFEVRNARIAPADMERAHLCQPDRSVDAGGRGAAAGRKESK